jgi:hypothetical protein
MLRKGINDRLGLACVHFDHDRLRRLLGFVLLNWRCVISDERKFKSIIESDVDGIFSRRVYSVDGVFRFLMRGKCYSEATCTC